MSTSPGQASLAPSWKQEVNRRIAAHKSQKNLSQGVPETHLAVEGGAVSRAAQAAARVAARYAKAPTYSEMFAEEARGAVRAAEAASRAAWEAQAVAESLLAGLEAASADEQRWEQEPTHVGASNRILEMAREAPVERATAAGAEDLETESEDRRSFGIRWDADLPMRPMEPAALRASRGPAAFEKPVEDGWTPDLLDVEAMGSASIEPVEPAPAVHANLIEFPRELVATRKVRPRRAEGRYAVGPPVGQLSIFEVDPESISTEPEAPAALNENVAPAWQGPDWSSIELDAEPAMDHAEEAGAARATPALQLAPFGMRSMAAVVDGALIVGAFLATVALTAGHIKVVPPMKELEVGSALALAVFGVVYYALFFTLAEGTPGMKYARVSLCTFDDEKPTREQLRSRLVALYLSLLPLGLGVAWAIFDEEHLSWHDRFSRTYLRRC